MGDGCKCGGNCKELGATGEFPEGKIREDDEGELRMAVAVDKEKQVVLLDFGKPVTWLGIPKDMAIALGRKLVEMAEQLES